MDLYTDIKTYFLYPGRSQRWSTIYIISYQEYTLSRWLITADVHLEHLAEVAFVLFLYCKSALLCTWKKSPGTTYTYGMESYAPHFENRVTYINCLEFLYTGDLSILFLNFFFNIFYSILFLYSTLYLYQYGLGDIYFIL